MIPKCISSQLNISAYHRMRWPVMRLAFEITRKVAALSLALAVADSCRAAGPAKDPSPT